MFPAAVECPNMCVIELLQVQYFFARNVSIPFPLKLLMYISYIKQTYIPYLVSTLISQNPQFNNKIQENCKCNCCIILIQTGI